MMAGVDRGRKQEATGGENPARSPVHTTNNKISASLATPQTLYKENMPLETSLVLLTFILPIEKVARSLV